MRTLLRFVVTLTPIRAENVLMLHINGAKRAL